jgi:hypothetical protein
VAWMAVKLSGSVTALFHSLRSGSNARNQKTHHQQQHQQKQKQKQGSQSRAHGVWAQLNCARKLCAAVSLARDRQHFFGRIAGIAVGTLPRCTELSHKSHVSCALSSFEVCTISPIWVLTKH